MLAAVKLEIRTEKNNGLGCQILVVMTHGRGDNCIYGTDLEKVNLTDLYELLLPLSIKHKPTVVILQACTGGDYCIATEMVILCLIVALVKTPLFT